MPLSSLSTQSIWEGQEDFSQESATLRTQSCGTRSSAFADTGEETKLLGCTPELKQAIKGGGCHLPGFQSDELCVHLGNILMRCAHEPVETHQMNRNLFLSRTRGIILGNKIVISKINPDVGLREKSRLTCRADPGNLTQSQREQEES